MKKSLTRGTTPAFAIVVAGLLAGSPAAAQYVKTSQYPNDRKPTTADMSKSEYEASLKNDSKNMVDAEKLSDNPQDYYGKTVTVKEDVADVLGPNLFTLDDGEFLGTSPDILVFVPNAEASPANNRTVTVKGVVHKFTYADFQNRYGWGWGAYPWATGYYAYGYPWYGPTANETYWVQYENRPIIIASSVKTPSGFQLVSNQQPNMNGSEQGSQAANDQAASNATNETRGATPDHLAPMYNPNAVTDLSKLTGSSAASLEGRDVHLTNVTVDRVTGEHGFWAKDDQGHRVFVALQRNIVNPDLRQGERVTVAGRIDKAPDDRSDIDTQKFGLNDQDVNQLTKDPVFIRASALIPATGGAQTY